MRSIPHFLIALACAALLTSCATSGNGSAPAQGETGAEGAVPADVQATVTVTEDVPISAPAEGEGATTASAPPALADADPAELEAATSAARALAEAEADIKPLTPGTKEYARAQKALEKRRKEAQVAAYKISRERELKAQKEARARAKSRDRRDLEKGLSGEEKESLAIREAAFRHLLSVEQPGEVVFLSATPLDSVNMRWNDPEPALMARLADLPVQLRDATDAVLTREAVPDPERPNRMVKDPVTGNAASVYWAEILKDSKNDEVRVDAGCFRGFLKSWGCILVMKKSRGVWTVEAQTAVWKT